MFRLSYWKKNIDNSFELKNALGWCFWLDKWQVENIFSSPKVVYFAFDQPVLGADFSLKTQKTPPDHILDSKIQTTCRMSVLITLLERYDSNKHFKNKFWDPMTWKKISETSKVR